MKRTGGTSLSLLSGSTTSTFPRPSEYSFQGNTLQNTTSGSPRSRSATGTRRSPTRDGLYARLLKVNNIDAVGAYFRERGVTYHFPMGCALHNDFREKKVYLATPVPTPWDLTALECRELKGDGKKTLGAGGLWFLKRDPKRVLITESILDSLAGEIVLEDKEISLCALNSAAYVNQLGDFLKEHAPDEVWLATDNDGPGIAARDKAVETISRTRAQIVLVEDHFKAGVKDLHKLLLQIHHERKGNQGGGHETEIPVAPGPSTQKPQAAKWLS